MLLRFGGFAYMVTVTAELPAIRKTWPDAHIDFITDQANTTVMEINPDAERVIIGRKLGDHWSIGKVMHSVRGMDKRIHFQSSARFTRTAACRNMRWSFPIPDQEPPSVPSRFFPGRGKYPAAAGSDRPVVAAY